MKELYLVEPYLVFYDKIKKSIGSDPFIVVERLQEELEGFYINLICEKYDQAIGIRCLLRKEYKIEDKNIRIKVFFKDKDRELTCEGDADTINHKRLALMFIKLALDSNPYFSRTRIIKESALGDIAVEFKPSVIQVYNNNKRDLYGNISFIARDLFADILNTTLFDNVKILYTTKPLITKI